MDKYVTTQRRTLKYLRELRPAEPSPSLCPEQPVENLEIADTSPKLCNERPMGDLGILPCELRCRVWQEVGRMSREGFRKRSSQFSREDWSRKKEIECFGLGILQVCRAIHDEMVGELYKFGELHLRLDPLADYLMMNDVRRLADTYCDFIPVPLTGSHHRDLSDCYNLSHSYYRRGPAKFVAGYLGKGKSMGFTDVKVEILAPSSTNPVELMNLRYMAMREDEYSLRGFLANLKLPKMQIILSEKGKSSWAGLDRNRCCFPSVNETDAEAVLLSIAYMRNIDEVEFVLPESWNSQQHILDITEQCKLDFKKKKCGMPWKINDPKRYAERRAENIYATYYDYSDIDEEEETTLIDRDGNLTLILDPILDNLPGQCAGRLRQQRFYHFHEEHDKLIDRAEFSEKEADLDYEALWDRRQALEQWESLGPGDQQHDVPPLDSLEWIAKLEEIEYEIRLDKAEYDIDYYFGYK